MEQNFNPHWYEPTKEEKPSKRIQSIFLHTLKNNIMTISKNEYQLLLIALGNQIFKDDQTAHEIEIDQSGNYSEEDKNNVDRSIRRQISLFDKIARKISAPTYELWQESNIQSLQMC